MDRAVQVVPVSEWEGLSFPEGEDGWKLGWDTCFLSSACDS